MHIKISPLVDTHVYPPGSEEGQQACALQQTIAASGLRPRGTGGSAAPRQHVSFAGFIVGPGYRELLQMAEDLVAAEQQRLRAVEKEQQAAATVIQRTARGMQARERFRVQTVAPGMVHTRIQGDSETFARVGMANIRTPHPKKVDVVSIAAEQYDAHVVGGDRIHFNLEGNPLIPEKGYTLTLEQHLDAQPPFAFINGGYFNLQGYADSQKPWHVSIGETVATGGDKRDHVPPPKAYADRYVTMALDNDSQFTSAPVLSVAGVPVFTDSDLTQERFKFPPSGVVMPGELGHAEHPNPRSAISLPTDKSAGNRYRLISAGSVRPGLERGSDGPGLTMPDLARVSARLDRMNPSSTTSVNLDGGAISSMGVVGADLTMNLEVQHEKEPKTSTLIAFAKKKRQPSVP